jgi:spore germination protein GerM
MRVTAFVMLMVLVVLAVMTVRTLNRLPDATLYLVRSEATSFTLVPTQRRLGSRDTESYARLAVRALAAGPTREERQAGLGSAVPDGTEVRSASLRNGVLRVDLTGSFVAGGGSASMRGRLEQLRWTLTQPSSVDAVELLVEGEPLQVLGGEGLMVEPTWRRTGGEVPRW